MRLPVFVVRLLILGVVLCGCSASSDGGSSGTGLTSVTGNVVSAQTSSLRSGRPVTWLARLRALLAVGGTAIAQNPVEDIRVSIEGTNVAGRTDANGFFRLEGDFAGPIGMRLERPDDALSARLVIVVPNGGALTLSNVRINGAQVGVDSERVTYDGVVLSTNCAANLADTVSSRRPDDGNVYRVHLGGASLQDVAGAPISCSNLRGNQVVRVDGAIRSDGDVDADEVKIDDDRSSESGGDDNSGPGGGGDDVDDDSGSGGDGGDDSGPSGGEDGGGSDSGPD
jgi:hypothetical protein